ncbi:unnamed protein product [Toxocara canis]|uniref:Uncharacterized protein n=1 Tax=Toxocara canis TaxID=6265 RepID=A0A183V6W1_TOXCA|nr:unnamed protein product [Toxocara canis]
MTVREELKWLFFFCRDTPTFTPLVSSLSDSQAPIWNPSTFSEDSSTFNTPTTSPMKLLDPPLSQSPLLTHSPLHPPSSTTEPFEAKHTFNCVSRRTVPHSHESNREHSAKMNLASRRLVFSTDSSQEISALSTTSMEHDSPQTLLDECIQLPKTPEKERQHQELIAALSQCLLAEECILNNKICPSSSPARLYPLLPIEQHATVSSASNRLYDTPTSSDQAISLVAAKCDNDSDDHLVKLSFTREPSRRDSSTSKHCRRSRSFVEKPTTSNGVLNVDEKSFEILRNRSLPSSSGHVDNCVTNGRPKVPPPPPPPPPHASEPRPQTEFEAALRATEP